MHDGFWTYIIGSRSGTLYIGMTNNIERRMREHKAGEFEGFASKYRCNRLVYYEKYDDVTKAIGREKQLKGWTRAKKIALIERLNPRWFDLAESWGAEMRFPGQPLGTVVEESDIASLNSTVSASFDSPAPRKLGADSLRMTDIKKVG